ncbi:MAG TPA: hypothetical protein PKE61_03365, partial [Burkholderiaceae bacterium]|nr:hypothetical protein [Burkholderiaceae bacterium]
MSAAVSSLSPPNGAALVVAEHDGGHLADATRIALTGARACAPVVDLRVGDVAGLVERLQQRSLC